MVDYSKTYRQLGLQIEPLYDGYTPDDYAKKLMKDVLMPEDVVYAVSTNIDVNLKHNSLNENKDINNNQTP